jgi:DNA-binding beta-propeller fold protein YncE
MVSPVGLAFDAQSRLFVSDSSGKLFAFGPGGEVLWVQTRAGTEPLVRPTGIVFDRHRQRLYVVDTAAHRVDAFRDDGTFELSFGGRGSEPGRFNFPTQIASSPAGELVIADTLNFRIQIFDAEGRFLDAFGHHGDGSGDFALPKGVAVDRDGVIYVVDGLFDNVQLFDRQGRFLMTLGSRGGGFGQFWLPAGAFVNEAGELFVCDSYNRRVQVFHITEKYAPGIS